MNFILQIFRPKTPIFQSVFVDCSKPSRDIHVVPSADDHAYLTDGFNMPPVLESSKV